jgi:hypothetical protein
VVVATREADKQRLKAKELNMLFSLEGDEPDEPPEGEAEQVD